MIVLLSRFAPMSAEVEAEVRRNLRERFMPALRRQPGFIDGYWGKADAGRPVGVTLWESRDAAKAGSAAASATPLLPGQDPEKLPSPERFEWIEIEHRASADS